MSQQLQLAHRETYDRIVLQNTDTVFMHCQPNTHTLLWRGSDGLKTERETEINSNLYSEYNYKIIYWQWLQTVTLYKHITHHEAEVDTLYNDCGLYLNIYEDHFKTISKYFATSTTIGLFHCSHIDTGVIKAAEQKLVRTQHFEEKEENGDTINRIMTNTEGSISRSVWTTMINKIMSLIHTAQCLILIMHHSGLELTTFVNTSQSRWPARRASNQVLKTKFWDCVCVIYLEFCTFWKLQCAGLHN